VNQFNATGSYNLAELNQQIAQIINLNGRSFAGTGKLEAFVVFDSNGVIHGGGNIVTENLSAVVLPNTLPIQDAKLEMGFAGNVTTGANVHARISVLRVNGDSIQFVANSPSTWRSRLPALKSPRPPCIWPPNPPSGIRCWWR